MVLRLLLLCVATHLVAPAAEPPRSDSGQELVDRLLDRVVAGERAFLERMRAYTPFMETYVQAAVDEASVGEVRDHYLMGKMQLTANQVYWETFAASEAFG